MLCLLLTTIRRAGTERRGGIKLMWLGGTPNSRSDSRNNDRRWDSRASWYGSICSDWSLLRRGLEKEKKMRHLGRYNDIIWIPFAANTPSIPLPICNARLGLGKENVEKPKHCTLLSLVVMAKLLFVSLLYLIS